MQKKLKKRADGRYVRVIIDPVTHKRVSVYGKSEREVERKINERKQTQVRGERFAVIADDWWEDAQERLAVQSLRPYRAAYVRAVEHFGDIPINQIRRADVVAYIRELTQMAFAQRTISNHKTVLSQIFEYALNSGRADSNPVLGVRLSPDLPKSKRTAASAMDESIIRAAADDEFLLPFISLMTGMRKGEILALQWKDIDFEHDIISVTKSLCHEANVPIVKSPKTEAGTRIVPLLAPLKERLLKVVPRSPDAFLISPDEDGMRPMSETQYQRALELFRERTGVQCTAHQLRHSFATIAFEAGVPVKSVQEILGHRQLSTTMDIYTEFRKKSYSEATELLNKNWSK